MRNNSEKVFTDMAIEELNSDEFGELLHSFEVMESTSNNLYHIKNSVNELRLLPKGSDIEFEKILNEVEDIIENME